MAGTIALMVLRTRISQMKSNDNRNANRVLAGTVKELSVAPEVVVHPPYDSLPLQLGMQVDAIIQVFCSDEGNAKCKMQKCKSAKLPNRNTIAAKNRVPTIQCKY